MLESLSAAAMAYEHCQEGRTPLTAVANCVQLTAVAPTTAGGVLLMCVWHHAAASAQLPQHKGP